MTILKQCATDADCENDKSIPLCGADSFCESCTTDAQCVSLFPGDKEICDTVSGRCIQCTADNECDNPNPICNQNTLDQACIACKTDA